MRVISGDCRGTSLKAVRGKNTRPTTDKVKETLFNIIGPYFNGGKVLDLYGGSGGLGIEALSRGADKAIFVDRYMPAVQTIRENLERCHLQNRAEIYRHDAGRALTLLGKRHEAFSLIFLDPPYDTERIEKDIEKILLLGLLQPKGYLVIEHSEANQLKEVLSPAIQRWRFQTAHEQTAISIYYHYVEES